MDVYDVIYCNLAVEHNFVGERAGRQNAQLIKQSHLAPASDKVRWLLYQVEVRDEMGQAKYVKITSALFIQSYPLKK